jgi:hypothetical protein
MSENTLQSRLRAVVTQVDEQFIVCVCVVAPQEDPTLVGEQTVPTLNAAHAFIEQLAYQTGCRPETFQTIYNLHDGHPPCQALDITLA